MNTDQKKILVTAGIITAAILAVIWLSDNYGGGGGSLEAAADLEATRVAAISKASCISSGGKWVEMNFKSKIAPTTAFVSSGCPSGYVLKESASISRIVSIFKLSGVCCTPSSSPSPIMCTQEVRSCPGGSTMPRGSDCVWHSEQCPTTPMVGGNCTYTNALSCTGSQLIQTATETHGTCTPIIVTPIRTCQYGCTNGTCNAAPAPPVIPTPVASTAKYYCYAYNAPTNQVGNSCFEQSSPTNLGGSCFASSSECEASRAAATHQGGGGGIAGIDNSWLIGGLVVLIIGLAYWKFKK